MAQEQARRGAAHGPGRRDELPRFHGKHLGADHPGVPHPSEDRKGEQDVSERGAAHGGDPDGEQDPRERQQDVAGAGEDAVGGAPEEAGEGTGGQADEERDADRSQPHGEREARAVDQPGKDVAPELVLPEPVGGGRPRQPLIERLGKRVARRDHRSEDGGEEEQGEENHPGGGAPVPGRAAQEREEIRSFIHSGFSGRDGRTEDPSRGSPPRWTGR